MSSVRHGAGLRETARTFGVSLRMVQRWVARAGDDRLDRVAWGDRPSRPGRTRRTPGRMEELVLDLRASLREGPLGEYGAAAIRRELEAQAGAGLLDEPPPSLRTIGRILERRGAVDARRRVRRPPPPVGWYLPEVAAGRAEVDSFDVIAGLKPGRGLEVDILTGISLLGGLPGAWPAHGVTARSAIGALTGRWRADGLPGYAQFDNDTRFHGPHGFHDRLGRLSVFCLELGVVPVFAPQYESGFQAAVESFNARWQAKVWQRFEFESLGLVRARSDRYLEAVRAKLAERIDRAPRRPFPSPWEVGRDPACTIVYLRRTNAAGAVFVFGEWRTVDPHWQHRLVRAEVDLPGNVIRCYALRRREPRDQPLLAEIPAGLALTPRFWHLTATGRGAK